MVAKIDRTGEIGYNNFGSKMEIIKYRKYSDVDIYFPKYNWITKHKNCNNFKRGNIICPYEPRYFEIGYLGEGKYKTKENGKYTKCYNTWVNMLMRCYYSKYHEKESTYKDCTVCNDWLNFQNFAKWFYDNYYEIEGQRMCLDKDIINKGNKIYSPETCIFVPQIINTLFVKRNNDRGKSPIGTKFRKNGKYQVDCSIYDFKINESKSIYLGVYNTEIEAFNVYKEFKEKYIKEVANLYKDKIPQKLYNALINYEVEITD